MNFNGIQSLDQLLKYAKTPTIFVDLDGVLVNFDKGFKDLEGCSPEEYIKEHGKSGFWETLPKHSRFFKDLEWMPDGELLWNSIKQYDPTILTAPPRKNTMPHAEEDKRYWVKEHIGKDVEVIVESHKEKYAKKDYILIDDRISNIDAWENAGGTAILHTSTEETLQKLKELV